MNPVVSSVRGVNAAKVAALFGTASFVTLAGLSVAQAQVNEVLITGSLIAGAPSVGVPVTNVGEEQFQEMGAITAAEMLRGVPAIDVDASLTSLRGGGTTGYGQNVAIHGFAGSGGDATTLLLIDGRRWPIQGHGGDTVDPSIIPQLAVERIDILTAGASAVYGSDAVTGVINVVLKKDFDGAMSNVNLSMPVHVGQGIKISASHLHGVSWDTGNITLTGETYFQQRVQGSAFPDLYTANFEPWGLPDRTPLGSQHPGVISLGSPSIGANPALPSGLNATTGTRFCSNCYYIPHGAGANWGDYATNGSNYPRLNWANDIQPNQFIYGERNEDNQRNPYHDGWATPQQQREAFVGTFNQTLTDDLFGLGEVALTGTTFYSNRKGTMYFNFTPNSGNSREHVNARQGNGILIPTANPYRPVGLPNNARMQLNFSPMLGGPARINFENIATRYEFGLDFNSLPFDWVGDMFYSMSNEQNNTHSTRMINANHALAALGHTITSSVPAGFAAYTKPAGIPYLNVFCDALVLSQCNSPDTINYILGGRNQNNQWRIRQMGVNTSGEIFTLPSGPIMGAVSFEHVSQHYWFTDWSDSQNTFNKQAAVTGRDVAKRVSHAFFGQLNVPLIGGEWSMPGIEALDLELGYRVDKYDFLDEYVKTPKIAANWTVGWGLTLRGAWGKSFRAPSFGQVSAQSGSRAIPYNKNFASPDLRFDCVSSGGVAVAGSATAILNPTCAAAIAYNTASAPVGIRLDGGAGLGSFARGLSGALRLDGRQKGLDPETAKQWVVGMAFAPTDGFLAGLTVDVSYFKIKIENTIRADNSGQSDPNNPLSRGTFVIRPDLVNPITHPNNAEFLSIIEGMAELGTGTATYVGDLAYEDIKYIQDNANANTGFVEYSGIDFDSRYDWDMGDWGSWHIGAAGYYEMDQTSKGNDAAPEESLYEGQNSGARLKRLRTRIGWTDGTFSATLFNLYRGHEPPTGNLPLPACYYADGFGQDSCFPGSQYFPQDNNENIFADGPPGHNEFDLSLGYNTGLMPANSYLQNIQINLTINNVLDRSPPFNYEARQGGREIRAYDARWSEYGRFMSLAVTKTW